MSKKTYSEDDPMVAENPHTLPYPSNVGAPVIRPNDIMPWKATRAGKANKFFQTKYEELNEQFKLLVESYQWNVIVYESTFNFEPVIGHSYYLYEKDDSTMFLSLIAPHEWTGFTFLGEFQFDTDSRWVKIDGN